MGESQDDEEDTKEEQSPKTEGKKAKEPSPKKRVKPNGATTSPPAKRGRKNASKAEEIELDAKVLNEAETLNFVSQLKNLAARADVSGKSHKQMLDALKANAGLVNKAKAALLGA